MRKYNRIARSLCAVMLAVSTLMPPPVARAVEPDYGYTDTYALTVEFGNLSFYYDYGIWDPNDMRYETVNSADPAEGTTAGFPGWYGFDGTANKITVINESANERARDVTVSLSYRPLAEGEFNNADVEDSVKDVTMQVTGDGWSLDGGKYTATVAGPINGAEENRVTGYIHLQGEPKNNKDGSSFRSDLVKPIGMLILRIDSWTN